jgi:hypothetical protein
MLEGYAQLFCLFTNSNVEMEMWRILSFTEIGEYYYDSKNHPTQGDF